MEPRSKSIFSSVLVINTQAFPLSWKRTLMYRLRWLTIPLPSEGALNAWMFSRFNWQGP